jgi:putative transposase
MGLVEGHSWLRTDELLAYFGENKHQARRAYAKFAAEGIGGHSPLREVSNQLLLGDEEFCARAVDGRPNGDLIELKRAERKAISKPLAAYFAEYRDPKEAMARAYRSLAYSMPEIARFARVSVKTVSRAINAFEGTY